MEVSLVNKIDLQALYYKIVKLCFDSLAIRLRYLKHLIQRQGRPRFRVSMDIQNQITRVSPTKARCQEIDALDRSARGPAFEKRVSISKF